MEILRHVAPDGTPLAVYRWDPEGAPRAILHIAHGMAEHARRYGRVAEAFTKQGFVVYAHDHRGHGESVKPGAALGHMAEDDAWERAVEDLHRLLREERTRHPDLPCLLLAHSMGSFMAQQLLYVHPSDVDAVALSGTNGPPPAIATAGRLLTRVERRRLGKGRSSAILQKLSFGDFNKGFEGRTEFDWLSRDPAEVDLYVADPHCGFALSTQSWTDFLDALPQLTKPRNLARAAKSTPVYVFAGSDDPVGDRGKGPEELVRRYRDAGLTDVTLRLYAGARHEVLNEINRQEVIDDLVGWSVARLGLA